MSLDAVRRVVVRRPGGYERLSIERCPRPVPGAGEVLLDVSAMGVNYADCVVRMGLYASAKKYVGWPITPGFEVAGRVSSCGPGVDDLRPGDEVFAVTRFGGYATAVVVPRAQVFRCPAKLGLVEAAGFPTAFLTADYACTELAGLRAGQRVLVHSAAGGVGLAATQLAARAGCEVVGVVGGSHKVEAARAAGARHVIDTSVQALWTSVERIAPDGFHAVLDANGVSTLRQSYRHLAPTGRLVVYGFHSMLSRGRDRPSWPKLAWSWLRTPRFDPLAMTGENRSVLAFNLSYLFDAQALLAGSMGRLLGWLEAGAIGALPTQTWPFEAVAEAHAALESGRSVGKLVLTA